MATIIDPVSAKSLIQEFQEQNASDDGPGLLTPADQLLNGFFIDRESLEALLSNPDVAGLSIALAKHPDFVGQPGNYFTLLYSGAELNTGLDAPTPYINTGDICAGPPPCPPMCSNWLQ
ncbi:hypothetical protein [Mucilaginibacter gotjawali]|uniref:Uncharacterized protein n=1 Tax=Mucilaginibacter gotjawali TaxID=1550579 RepID=A0A839SDY0_9SPHI|nr:hypothetical protein [Mucilaginibacter gotjawali]MBB3054849.1 hypothetical protein [Mucilaginibacter gotjawali]